MPRKPHLKYMGVQKRTVQLYRREVSLFFEFLEFMQLPLPSSYPWLDQRVADYINHLFQEGESISKAGWLLSGLRRFYPRVRKELCLAQQWYTNWAREHTPERATPMPWKVPQALVGLCWHEQWYHLGLCLLLGFAFFLRTQEVLALHISDIEVSLPANSIVIRLRRTKTSKQHLQALTLEHTEMAALTAFALKGLSDVWLWPWSPTLFRSSFTSLCDFFFLTPLSFVPYSLRRGGATHFYVVLKSLDFVMVQGRWKDQRTCRLYLDDARAMLVNFTLPDASVTLLRQFRRHLSTSRYAK